MPAVEKHHFIETVDSTLAAGMHKPQYLVGLAVPVTCSGFGREWAP